MCAPLALVSADVQDLHEDPLSLPKKLWNGMRERKLRRAFKSLPLGVLAARDSRITLLPLTWFSRESK